MKGALSTTTPKISDPVCIKLIQECLRNAYRSLLRVCQSCACAAPVNVPWAFSYNGPPEMSSDVLLTSSCEYSASFIAINSDG
jgi:hypothetical protein